MMQSSHKNATSSSTVPLAATLKASRDDRASSAAGRLGASSHSFRTRMVFQSPFGACNFIVTWDGEDVRELLDAILFARRTGDRFIQDKLIEYVLSIPFRNPRPTDIPAFVGKPVWAVDKHDRVLIGMPGSETIIEANALREMIGTKPQSHS